ncbi:MAG: hypothetical protein ABF296_03020 [Oceanococcaceae bacterium]
MLHESAHPSLDVICESIRQVRHSRELCRLADALVYSLNIAHGSALVPYLAPGRAGTNRDAVVEWLRAELDAPSLELSQACVQVLLPKLHRHLEKSLEAANDAYF